MRVDGKILQFEYRNIAGREKKVVTLKISENEQAFIEFRGRLMDELADYKENAKVRIYINFEGKVSKNSGQQFNNLVAVSIEKL